MEMDLSSMWLQEPELEDQAGLMKPYMNMVDHKSSSSTADDSNFSDLSTPPEISYTVDTEYCFTDEWLSTTDPTSCCFEQQQTDQMKLQPPPATNHHQKTATLSATSSKTTTSFTISFGDLNNPINNPSSRLAAGGQETGKFQATARRNSIQTQEDHVVAERKRREKLNRHFISLSALLPNLTKMDKGTVLEDAANYIKELEERVKELEGGVVNRKQDATKCVIAIDRSFTLTRAAGDDDAEFSSNDTINNNSAAAADSTRDGTSAEIEVRMSGSCVLVRILLSHQKTSSSSSSNKLVCKVVDKMQNQMGLSIISSSLMPFANTTTLIAVVAQIEGDLCMTAADLVKNLQLAL